MSRAPHELILASAGTGKTWQLTGRFLELLLNGNEPERILATTFTRKAAGEILDRVLERLVEAIEDEGERAALTEQVGRPVSLPELTAILARVTRSIHRFRVRTLDAFFVNLGRLFALDLGLPPEWSIVEEAEDEAMRREAVAEALRRADRGILVDLLRGLQRADAASSVEWVLLGKVRAARDAFLDAEKEAWTKIEPPPAPSPEDLAEARAAIDGMDVPRTKAGTPVKHWVNARADLLDKVDAGAWDAVMDVGLVKKVVDDEAEFSRHPIAPEVRQAIQTLLEQSGHELVRQVAIENEATLRWLERFEEAFEDRKREERAYRFEDLPKALRPRDEDPLDERKLDLWYRLDGRIDHLLLDEFQDTSPVQWRILEKLADEILADGTGERSFFCVGDVKQSIYGFRESEPRLLAEMRTHYPQCELRELVRNWRSSAVILNSVDRVFEAIGDNAAFKHDAHVEAARAWQGDYAAHVAARDLPGAAWLLEAAEAREGEPSELPPLALAAQRARAIAEEAPQATIGILLRKNRHMGRMIYLLREVGLHASGEGGNYLTDSEAVLHLISLLHLADHPADSAAAFHLATSPLAERLGLTEQGFRDEASDLSLRTRHALAEQGFGAFCGSFRDTVAENYGTWDQRRFDQLVDLAYAYDGRAGLRADGFVDHVRLTKVEDPSATRVQVMTVHGAKGLEFDAVILPELDDKFFPHDLELLRHRPDPRRLIASVSNSRGRDVCDLDPSPQGLKVMRAEEEQRGIREVLCLLYVAMTRAKHRLDMIVPFKGDPSKLNQTHAGLLRAALGSGPASWDAEIGAGVLWAHPDNDARWFPEGAPHPVSAAAASAEAVERPTGLFRPSDAPRSLPRRTPSAQEGAGLLPGRLLLRSPAAEARVRGNLVHRWLEEVEWMEGFERSDEELLALTAPLVRDDELQRLTLAGFRNHLTRASVRQVLRRDAQETDADDVELVVWRERSFSVVLPDEAGRDELWSGSFDRVVLHVRGGWPVRADLIDYKTDDVGGSALEERADHYRPQVAAYRRVLAHLTDLDESAIRTRLLFLEADATVDL